MEESAAARGLDRAGAVRGVRADRVPGRHLRTILSAICGPRLQLPRPFPASVRSRFRRRWPRRSCSRTKRSGHRRAGISSGAAGKALLVYSTAALDRLSHGYASVADFVIRHSAVMLLIYVALIGSAGWLLFTTPQGFIPAQDRGYVIVSVQLPGAASLARTTDVVREIEKIRARYAGASFASRHSRLLGRDPNTGGQCRGLVPGVRRAGSAPEEGTVRGSDHRRLAQTAVGASGGVHHRHSAARGTGIGTGGGFTMRIQDRQGRGPDLLAAATDELVAAARKAPGLTSVFSPFTANTPQVFVDIDRVQGAEARRADPECDRNDPDLFRLGLRQRLQPFRPAPIMSPRRRICRSARRPPISPGCAPVMPPATWCCSAVS